MAGEAAISARALCHLHCTPTHSMRSYLYAPANRADLLGKLASRGADAIVIDLEDSVPLGEKITARANATAFLNSVGDALATPVFIRVNAGETGLADLTSLPLRHIAGVRLPKTEDPELVAAVDRILADAEQGGHRVVLHPIIESVHGLYHVDDFVRASTRVERFVFGASDYVLDIGGEVTAERIETLHARGRLVARSRYLGIGAPIAHAYMPIGDLDGLRLASLLDRAMGFFGRSCIHPTQVAIVNDAFTFGTRDIEHARRMVDGFLEAALRGRGSVVLGDGTFVDEASCKRAQRLLVVAARHAERDRP